MIDKLPHITTVVWDFDGVFYDFDALPNNEYNRICDRANAKAVCKIIPSLEYKKAVELAHESYEIYKESITSYIPYAKEAGIDEAEFKNLVFLGYHSELFTDTMNICPFILDADDERTELFNKLAPHVKHGILSHSSAADFVVPSLERMELKKFFTDDYLWDFKKFNFHNKSKSAKGISRYIEALNIKPSELVFVEDTAKNLQISKEAFPEITTVLKTHEKIEKPEGVDIMIYSQNEFLKILLKNK